MSNNNKGNGLFIGAGWNKVSKEGKKFISAQGGNKELKLYAEDANTGEKFEVKYFSIFKNQKAQDERKKDSPDYYLVYFPKVEE